MVGILILAVAIFVIFPSVLFWLVLIALGSLLAINFPWIFVAWIFLVLLNKVLEA